MIIIYHPKNHWNLLWRVLNPYSMSLGSPTISLEIPWFLWILPKNSGVGLYASTSFLKDEVWLSMRKTGRKGKEFAKEDYLCQSCPVVEAVAGGNRWLFEMFFFFKLLIQAFCVRVCFQQTGTKTQIHFWGGLFLGERWMLLQRYQSLFSDGYASHGQAADGYVSVALKDSHVFFFPDRKKIDTPREDKRLEPENTGPLEFRKVIGTKPSFSGW